MNGCGIREISPLRGNTTLVTISLSRNLITDISHLSGCTSLRVINIVGNNITTTPDLSKLTSLSLLSLHDNKIDDISSLSSLHQMCRCIYLRGNLIRDVSPLHNNASAHTIVLHSNLIPYAIERKMEIRCDLNAFNWPRRQSSLRKLAFTIIVKRHRTSSVTF